MITRRELMKLAASLPMMAAVPYSSLAASQSPKIMRKIPSSGELIPAVGMGSYQTFNVAGNEQLKKNLIQVLETFFTAGGRLIDSSPMYGQSESVLGELMSKVNPVPKVFAASKVWTYGKQAGIDSVHESQQRMQVNKMDLMQIHNLRDWKVHIQSLNKLKENKAIRYTGITTSRINQYDDFEQVMRTEKIDFVQLNYNIKVREAEKRLLPLAIDKGIGVIINMPFEKGRLFKLVKNKALPNWAAEFDCKTWGQFFLKFIISHPAVTCVIPATSKVHHMQDNMTSLVGALPDTKTRQKMYKLFEQL
ncbi:aldo/keto reductase [Aliikangiella sp. IMCC44359]|uniref:aldo/keto reductase n=1 Tax=Aliikangiella sp. IMCC44359 TaxID=3459125 RepID=UPI00403A7EC9